MEKKTLGSFLSALRRAQGLTQQEVADRLAVSNKAVSRWERDEAMPDILLLPAIADLFGVTVDELLRGERLRDTHSSPTANSESSADSTETEQTASEASQPEPDPRALRGLRALTKRAETNFRTFAILAIFIAYVGLLVMGTASYGFYRPAIGFLLLTLFCVASMTVLWISYLRLRDTINEQASEESDICLPAPELAAVCYRYADWIWQVCFANAFSLTLGTTLRLLSRSHAVLLEKYAALLFLIVALVYFLIYTVFKARVIRRLCRPWDHICGSIFDAWTPSPLNLRRRISLTLWQIIPAAVGAVGATFISNYCWSGETAIDYVSILSITLLLLGITAACVTLPLHLRKESKGSPARRGLVISGVRNLILIAIGILTVGNGVTFVRWSDDGKAWETGQYWHEEIIIVGIVASLAIILCVELLRHYLQKKKS